MVVAGSSDSRVLDLLGFHVAGCVELCLQVRANGVKGNRSFGFALDIQCELGSKPLPSAYGFPEVAKRRVASTSKVGLFFRREAVDVVA